MPLRACFDLWKDDFECVLAADAGDIEAQCDLGLLFLAHELESEALDWLRGAARYFYPEAMHWLGRCLIAGQGTQPPDTEEGILWLRRAAKRGHVTAGYMVAWLDEPDRPPLQGAELEAELDRIERAVVLKVMEETARGDR